MSQLFSPLNLRDISFKNRIFVSPMCQYSSRDGLPTAWHMVHLGSRAVGGAGLVMVEASAVSPQGRISPYDSGIWSGAHSEAFESITRFIREQGAVAGIQLAHAGRKASVEAPWRGGEPVGEEQGGWLPEAPSALPFSEGHRTPREMTGDDLDRVVEAFVEAAGHARDAGFQVLELHMAHGYLLHSFLSPLSNRRTDDYGGSLENRARLPLRVARALRAAWPEKWPLFVRVSATDWVDGGWDLEQTLQLCAWMKDAGVDLIDCSSGGIVPHANIPTGPGFQTPFAYAVRSRLRMPTGAVGLITSPQQAEHIVRTDQADAVFLARELLRDPYWPLRAARELGAAVDWPAQYQRARL